MYDDGNRPPGKSAGELADEYLAQISAASGEIESAFDTLVGKSEPARRAAVARVIAPDVAKAIPGSSTSARLRALREARDLLRGLMDGR